jgi:hypothetical protein
MKIYFQIRYHYSLFTLLYRLSRSWLPDCTTATSTAKASFDPDEVVVIIPLGHGNVLIDQHRTAIGDRDEVQAAAMAKEKGVRVGPPDEATEIR